MRVSAIPARCTGRADCLIRATVPASLDAIEQVFLEFRRHCKCLLQRPDCFMAELLLREALTNAVVHGSQCDPEKSVRCAMRMKGRTLLINVVDQGQGFGWRSLRGGEAEVSSCSGRGMEIFRKYATRVRFSNQGNAITLVKVFDES